MTPRHAPGVDAIRELEGMRALARALAHGDADDLLQDAAVAALEHPPATNRPVRPWLATVILNRWRMNRRGEARRTAREQLADVAEEAPDPIDRARLLQRLSDALVALDEPFRQTVIARYLDGKSCAQIARELGVPAGTVRWRLKTGLARLRAALDDAAPRRHWQLALVPAGALVRTTSKISLLAFLLLLLAGGAVLLAGLREKGSSPASTSTTASPAKQPALVPAGSSAPVAAEVPVHAEPTPGPGKARVELGELAGGAAAGRVINWSTGDGVPNAELTFTGELGAVTVRSGEHGAFELAPAAPGEYTLTAIAAPGFLPYAPEYLHSSVHVTLAKNHAVRGLTVFLFPALDYHGKVVDEAGKPVANAHVRLLGTPQGEQAIARLATEWTSDKDGAFVFHAADGAVFEASAGDRRGWGVLDGDVAITHQLVIAIGKAPPRDATITGRVVDDKGAPIPDVLVRAEPEVHALKAVARATAFATTGADGSFELRGLDREAYTLSAEEDDHAPVTQTGVLGDTQKVTLTMTGGALLAGTVTAKDSPVPAFTLLAFKRDGAAKHLIAARSFVVASGAFSLRVEPGTYDLVADASGWAPATATATAPAKDVALKLSPGATLTGQVVSAVDHTPVKYARVLREALGGGASAQPANAGTVTRDDGTFELTGIPPGPLSISVGAGNFNPKIQAGMTAVEGQTIGPIAIALTPVAPGEQPRLELVGIGVAFKPSGDALEVTMVVPGGGAEAAGISVGDKVVSVDGAPTSELGLDGAVARIRGQEGTSVALGVMRGDKVTVVPVERRKLKT
jgi:RNA polymerase sigma factor (sigma-70 family)